MLMAEGNQEHENGTPRFGSGGFGRILMGLIVTSLLFWGLFLAAGGPGWTRGWLFVGVQSAGHAVMLVLVVRKDPELARRRATYGEGTKRWDFVMLGVFGSTFLAILLVAAFDAGNGWSTMAGYGWWIAGLLLFCIYVVILTWSMLVNTHFEKTVRIQTDRNHQVIDTGPYRIVRHPGYVGVIVGFILSAPLLLGSWWAYVPAAASAIGMIVRTVLEDRTLREELEGYEEYAQRVRYRLMPGIW